MYKLYGRNTCTFGIVAEFSVPAAGSQSNPYFNVNKWGISFISLSLSSNNKTEKSSLHFQRLVQSWDWARMSPWVYRPTSTAKDGKTKNQEKRGHIALHNRNVKSLSLRSLLLAGQIWEVHWEGGWTSTGQAMESTSECQSAFQLILQTHAPLDPFTEIRLRTIRGLPRGLI